jgi:hypothetical protein
MQAARVKGQNMKQRTIMPIEVCWRGFNVIRLGVSTSAPSIVAACRLTGQTFTVTGPAHADLFAELVQLIDQAGLWRRSTIDHGWLAVATDQAGRHWRMRPPTMPQGVPAALVA